MTLQEFCKGKIVDIIAMTPRGRDEGCFVSVIFSDGTHIWLTDYENAFDENGERVNLS